MSYQLAILRHAKSDWATGVPDHDRPLNQRGKQDAPKIGEWLKKQAWQPDIILSSPAQRAKETIIAVAQAAGISTDIIDWQEAIYLASIETLLRQTRSISPGASRAMLVGHNPGLEDLVIYLSDSSPELTDSGKLFTTANLAILEFDRPWKQIKAHSGKLLHLVRPKEL